jgi:hypothetical protein
MPHIAPNLVKDTMFKTSRNLENPGRINKESKAKQALANPNRTFVNKINTPQSSRRHHRRATSEAG